MFGVLCEAVLYNKNMTQATYLEAIPCALGSRVSEITGYRSDGPMMLVAMEYGKNFSGPGKDPFHDDRVTGENLEAHKSNFLHPVLYHYNVPFTHKQYLAKPRNFILPLPDRIHHIIEDFTTKFDAHATHILSLRHFISACIGQDLRFYYADQCMMLAMTRRTLPIGCRHFESEPGPSNLIFKTQELDQALSSIPSHVLPFESIY